MTTDLSQLRADYTRSGLTREELAEDPFAQFKLWFDQACDAGLPEPNAMTLATCGADHRPSSRIVLLKGFDPRGFVFYTNFESVKARQLAENPEAALTFLWLGLERQVNISGRAERVPSSESLRYFLSRPKGSQVGAWVSQQSSVITSRKLLEMKFEEMKRKFSGGEIPLPSFWGGFRIVPRSIEFWQGRSNRLHDRFLYRRDPIGAPWIIERLSP